MDTQITLNTRRQRPKMLERLRNLFFWFGVFSFLFVLSAFTKAYQPVAEWLAVAEYSDKCDYIVLLPAGPIPNITTLGRTYQTALEAQKNPSAKVIISNKLEGRYIGSTLWTIKVELMLRGVPRESILLEKQARSTNEHAKYIKETKMGDYKKDSYLLVTSPSHVKRSVLAFKAAGFAHVYASAASESYGWEDIGEGLFIRYKMWNRLVEQVFVLREVAAIVFYKIRGWA
ncbi:MAG: YdcF family protein [Nitrospinota bacterium]|nr:YdcF family protein [Nitrospinota bacterium]